MDWKDISVFEEVDGRKICVLKTAYTMEFFGDPQTVCEYGVKIFDYWCSMLPADRSQFYIDWDSCSKREVTPRSLRRLLKRLEDAPEKAQFFAFSDTQEQLGDYNIEIMLRNRTSPHACHVAISMPVEFVTNSGEKACYELFRDWVNIAPFWCATASWGFAQLVDATFDLSTYPVMIRTALRYLGLMMRDRSLEEDLRAQLKSAGWLTFLSKEMQIAISAGEIPDLPGVSTQTMPVSGGIILQAGSFPPIADINLGVLDSGPLRVVNRLIRPVRAHEWRAWNLFDLDRAASERWFERLD